jgi:hypothetical protein
MDAAIRDTVVKESQIQKDILSRRNVQPIVIVQHVSVICMNRNP